MKKFVSALLIAALSTSFVFNGYSFAAKKTETADIEKASLGVVFYETLGGFAGPIVTIVDLVNRQNGVNCCNCNEYWDRGYIALPIILFPLSIPYGVSVVGKSHNQGGSFWNALLGSLVFLGSWAAASSDPAMDNALRGVGYYVFDVLGAVIGYNIFKPAATVKTSALSPGSVPPAFCSARTKAEPGAKFNMTLFEAKF
jgi:hypothetical protein